MIKLPWRLMLFFLPSIALSIAAEPKAPDTLSQGRFTAKFLELLEKKKPGIAAEPVGDLHVRAHLAGKSYNSFLDGYYTEYRGDIGRQSKVLSEAVKNTVACYKAGVRVSLDRIVPLLKPSRFLKDSLGIDSDSGAMSDSLPCVFERYNDQLVIVYAQDVKTHLEWFTVAEVKKVCPVIAELRRVACCNLTRLLPPVKTLDDNGVYMISAGESYVTSMLLYHKFWQKGRFSVAGDPVVAVPARELVLVAGSADPKGIKKITVLAEKISREGAAPLVPDLFVRKDSMFVKFTPPVPVGARKRTPAKTIALPRKK